MNDDQFWSLIDSTRRGAEDDPDAHIEALTAALAELPEPEIIELDRIFTARWLRAYTWDLWAAAYIIANVYAIKMAGVFMISTSTVITYTRIVPPWIAAVGYVLAFLLLVASAAALAMWDWLPRLAG